MNRLIIVSSVFALALLVNAVAAYAQCSGGQCRREQAPVVSRSVERTATVTKSETGTTSLRKYHAAKLGKLVLSPVKRLRSLHPLRGAGKVVKAIRHRRGR